jgi:predicted nucleic acid-binding protein
LAFIDTTVFVAAFNTKDINHQRGKELLSKSFEKFKWLYTSDYVLDEIISVAWSRTKNKELILQLDKIIEESEKVRLLHVDETALATAKFYLRKFTEMIPLLTDWTSLVLMKDNNITSILSFDEHFNRVKGIEEFSHIIKISSASELP